MASVFWRGRRRRDNNGYSKGRRRRRRPRGGASSCVPQQHERWAGERGGGLRKRKREGKWGGDNSTEINCSFSPSLWKPLFRSGFFQETNSSSPPSPRKNPRAGTVQCRWRQSWVRPICASSAAASSSPGASYDMQIMLPLSLPIAFCLPRRPPFLSLLPPPRAHGKDATLNHCPMFGPLSCPLCPFHPPCSLFFLAPFSHLAFYLSFFRPCLHLLQPSSFFCGSCRHVSPRGT